MPILMVEKLFSVTTSHIGDEFGIVVCAEDADEAISLLRHESYDLVLLGMGSPPEDGFELIRRMRACGDDTPVLALTGPRAEDRAEALRLGADEALTDPVDPVTLDAQVAAILERARGTVRPVLRVGDLHLYLPAAEARFRDMPLNLTPVEFSILELLIRCKGSVLTKATFLGHAYAAVDEPDCRIVDVLICKLRKKLERAGTGRLISVVWGCGYMISELDALRQRINDVAAIESDGLVA
jgi:two-component system cell cycle response regulator CtrA